MEISVGIAERTQFYEKCEEICKRKRHTATTPCTDKDGQTP